MGYGEMIKVFSIMTTVDEVYGYCRVSTHEQKLDRQLVAMQEYGVETSKLFSEKESGKNMARSQFRRLLHVVRKGDLIVFLSLDRMGRNMREVMDTWRLLTEDVGVGIHLIDQPILNTSGAPNDLMSTFITQIMLQVLSFVAENERKQTLHRQQQGFEAAMKKAELQGKEFKTRPGRPRKPFPSEFWTIYCLWRTGEYSAKHLLEICQAEWGSDSKDGVTQRTFWRRLREIDQRYGDIPPEKLKNYIPSDLMENGILYDTERIEKVAFGYYNPYIADLDAQKIKKREYWTKYGDMQMRARREAEERAKEEEELRRIVFEARQRDFREKFGLEDYTTMEIRRGRGVAATHGSRKETDIVHLRDINRDLDQIPLEDFKRAIGYGVLPRRTITID